MSQLKIALEARVKDGAQEIDILAWMGRAALELVGQGMMGYSFDPLVEEVHNDFAEAVKAFVYVCCPDAAFYRSLDFYYPGLPLWQLNGQEYSCPLW